VRGGGAKRRKGKRGERNREKRGDGRMVGRKER